MFLNHTLFIYDLLWGHLRSRWVELYETQWNLLTVASWQINDWWSPWTLWYLSRDPDQWDSRSKRPRPGSLLMRFDPKKYIQLGVVSAFGPSFWLLFGPPLTAYCELLTFFGTQKVLSVRAAISASKQGFQKVVLLRKSNLNLARFPKRWGGAPPFMAVN